MNHITAIWRRAAIAAALASSFQLPALAQTPCVVRMPTLQNSYVGDCVAGYASGRGRATGVDAYEGGFRDGMPTGYGIYTYADGRRFDGDFVNGKANGRARFSYTNGDVLDGMFRDGQLVGVGRMLRSSGEALSVQMQGGGMVVVPQQAPQPPPPAPPPPAPLPAPEPAPAPTPAPSRPPEAAAQWSARLDFQDIFPSFIFATATRKPPPAPSGSTSRSLQSLPRNDPLGSDDPGAFLTGKPSESAKSRYIGAAGDANYMGDPWGLIGIRFTNPAPGTQVVVRVTVDEIAEPSEASFTLPKAGEYVLYPKLRYRYERLKAVSQPIPVNISWMVEVNGRPAGMQHGVARVRSLQDAPIAVQTARGIERLVWVFAGFVTEDAPWIDDIIREAFAGSNDAAVGYQTDADGVDRQVAAVYQALRRRGVRYSDITATSSTSDNVFSQMVRFPSDSIRTSQANCVDGTVLMASVLRKIGIEPIIVTGPGHALLGYFRSVGGSSEKPDMAFVETTMIGGHDFKDARTAGIARVIEWSEKANTDPRLQFVVVANARREGITPIPR